MTVHVSLSRAPRDPCHLLRVLLRKRATRSRTLSGEGFPPLISDQRPLSGPTQRRGSPLLGASPLAPQLLHQKSVCKVEEVPFYSTIEVMETLIAHGMRNEMV